MERKLINEFHELVRKGLKGSTEKQNFIFNSSSKNRKLLQKAQTLAKY